MSDELPDHGACRRWRVGATVVTQIVELETVVPRGFLLAGADPATLAAMDWLQPHYLDPAGKLRAAIQAFVVDDGRNRIIVDTCLGNDKQRAQAMWSRLNGPFLENLAAAGYPAETITHVVCTHLHVDHVGWNTRWNGQAWVPTFPNARYVIAREEWEGWHRETDDDRCIHDDSILPLFEHGAIDLKAWDAEICTDLRLVPTPGHTRGHASVIIETADGRGLITGDALHHPSQIAQPGWGSPADIDPALAAASRRGLIDRAARERLTVFGTHFARRPCGHVTTGPAGRRFDWIHPVEDITLDRRLPRSG